MDRLREKSGTERGSDNAVDDTARGSAGSEGGGNVAPGHVETAGNLAAKVRSRGLLVGARYRIAPFSKELAALFQGTRTDAAWGGSWAVIRPGDCLEDGTGFGSRSAGNILDVFFFNKVTW